MKRLELWKNTNSDAFQIEQLLLLVELNHEFC